MKRLADSVKFTTNFWAKLGERLTKSLLVRTFQKGVDVSGKSFKKYSEGYKKFRKKKGRNTSPVDHTFTGRFQKNLKRGRTTKSSVEYGFSQEGAKVDYAESNDRDILGDTGVDKKEGDLIESEVGDFIDEGLKAWSRETVRVKVGK